ncbi:hypothetical protein AK812_SmicGene24960 [Symbiodinium microadriaticum]|uniref:Uncharacterized protein n=1 Tax=Symbiodinium microadriaticum TaxID=2951 RepID=A0A1Q9DDD0_SYMMI|nr:hypothetical protein AK812_SmicGene24960 [Symbiodinium microadriaticum]
MPSTHLFATIRTVPLQRGLRRRGAHTHTHYARREARGGDSAESARTSLSECGSPSTVAVLENGKDCKLAEKDLAAATDINPDHRPTKAAIVAARCRRKAVRTRARANHRTKLAASALQRPPTSMIFGTARDVNLLVTGSQKVSREFAVKRALTNDLIVVNTASEECTSVPTIAVSMSPFAGMEFLAEASETD